MSLCKLTEVQAAEAVSIDGVKSCGVCNILHVQSQYKFLCAADTSGYFAKFIHEIHLLHQNWLKCR